MSSEVIEKWRSEAQKITDVTKLSVPQDVLLMEAVQVSKFVKTYWDATDVRPGLSSAGPKIAFTIADDILSIRGAAQDAQVEHLMIVESKVDTKALKERGQKVLNDITGVLEWYLDDGVDDDGDIRLASVKSDHQDDGESSASLAQALHDYGTLAKPLADQIDGLGNFDKGMIDEALELADKLGEVSTIPAMHSEKARNAKLLRDQLTNLLQQRIRLVRSAARFVFRDHPEIYREAASAYSRKYRAAAKRSQQPGQATTSSVSL